MSDGNPLAQEITAQIQLGLMGTIGKLGRQLRAIDRIAPRLKDGGVVRKVHVDRDRRRRSVGLSVEHRKIDAFGGLLYGAAAVAHDLTTTGADIVHGGQESRLDVGDMTLLEADRRLKWRWRSPKGEACQVRLLNPSGRPGVQGRTLTGSIFVGTKLVWPIDGADHQLTLDGRRGKSSRSGSIPQRRSHSGQLPSFPASRCRSGSGNSSGKLLVGSLRTMGKKWPS